MLKKLLITVTGSLMVLVASGVTAQQAQVVEVTQTEIKRTAGEVVQVRSNLLTLRHDDGSGRATYRIPRGASISVAGVETRLQDLQPGQRIRVYYRETETGRVIVLSPPEEEEMVVTIVEEVAPPPPPEPAPVALPSTASFLPLLGSLGIALLGLGGGIAVWRRHR